MFSRFQAAWVLFYRHRLVQYSLYKFSRHVLNRLLFFINEIYTSLVYFETLWELIKKHMGLRKSCCCICIIRSLSLSLALSPLSQMGVISVVCFIVIIINQIECSFHPNNVFSPLRLSSTYCLSILHLPNGAFFFRRLLFLCIIYIYIYIYIYILFASFEHCNSSTFYLLLV